MFNEEYIITTLGRVIADMEAAAAMKNENNISQKGYGGAPLGGMAAMAVSVMPKNKNNIIESIIKITKRKCHNSWRYLWNGWSYYNEET